MNQFDRKINEVELCKAYIKNTNRIIRSVDSDFILSIPQFNPTSESFLTLRYFSDYSTKKILYFFSGFVIGLIRILTLFFEIRIFTQKINKKYNALVISHDVINNKTDNDFYFGTPENIFELCGPFYKLIYISHSSFTCFDLKNKILINRNLSLYNYISLVFWYIKSIIFGICVHTKKPNSSFRRLILKSVLRGDGLEAYLRSEGLLKLVGTYSNKDQLSIYLTIEGHSWEKMIIKSLRGLNFGSLFIYGYSHSVIRKSTVWLKNLDKKNFSPDFLLMSKKIYFEYVSDLWIDKKIYTKLHLYKSLKPQINYKISRISTKPHILLLPEGLQVEEQLFIDFSNQIAKFYPEMKVSAKWHPNALKRTKSNTPNNIHKFSENENYTHVIYRGTYGIFDFLDSEKKLLYLSGVNIPNINPLFMTPDKFIEISMVEDLANIVNI